MEKSQREGVALENLGTLPLEGVENRLERSTF
jgi:hypothetical protein